MLALVKEYFWIFFISMVPIVELRGAVPAGLAMGLPVIPTYIVSVIGNMLPVPVILLFAKAVLLWCTKLPGGAGPFFYENLRQGRQSRRKDAGEGRARHLLGAVPVCGHPAAGHLAHGRAAWRRRCWTSSFGPACWRCCAAS